MSYNIQSHNSARHGILLILRHTHNTLTHTQTDILLSLVSPDTGIANSISTVTQHGAAFWKIKVQILHRFIAGSRIEFVFVQ